MPLLHLPRELLENILVLIYRDNARAIQTCRQTCHTLNAIITQFTLLQYLERLSLFGMHDPQLLIGDGGSVTVSPSTALSLPDRMEALQAWEEAWSSLGVNGQGVFGRKPGPDLCFTLSPWEPASSSSTRVTRMSATIIDPDPFPQGFQALVEILATFAGLDDRDRLSFGPHFITALRTIPHPAYSYLDLDGLLSGTRTRTSALGGIQGGEEGDADVVANYGRLNLDWTIINVPVWNVSEIALSAELDLAVVISGVEEQDTCYVVLRPLRFRDGTPHPHALVPKIQFPVTGVSVLHLKGAHVLGDYLLLWIVKANEEYSVAKLYAIAWKQGSVTLLREDSTRRYGQVHMISNDVLALIRLDPPGIELCRLSNMQNEGEEGATNTSHHSSQNDGPRMDRLCMLLFPPLRPQPDGIGARARLHTGFWVGRNGYQTFSREPWPEYHRAPLRRSQIFRQSMKDSVVSVVIGLDVRGAHLRHFEVIVRCGTLLSYADGVHVVPPASVVGDVDAKEGNEGDVVPWDAWGPRATIFTALNATPVGWRNVFGERMATIEKGGRIRIRDYNSYRIRQARDSNVGLDQNGTRRIVEGSTTKRGVWFEEDVTTMLPYLEIVVDALGCKVYRDIYLEQDEILLRVDDLQADEIPTEQNGGRSVKGLVLYSLSPE